jgi:hypothetical protein
VREKFRKDENFPLFLSHFNKIAVCVGLKSLLVLLLRECHLERMREDQDVKLPEKRQDYLGVILKVLGWFEVFLCWWSVVG